MHALVIDDSKPVRSILTKVLTGLQFQCIEAQNGVEALDRLSHMPRPTLITLNRHMPEMDGFQFAEELREKKEWLDIPVVVITAKDLTTEDHSRLKGNVEAIMQKGSYSRDELLGEVGQRIKKLKEEV